MDVLWCAEGLTSVFVGCMAVLPQKGSVCGQMSLYYAGSDNDEGVIVMDTTMVT